MSLAEKLYRKLLWLYPAEHRRLYGRLMVQHARDLSQAAQDRGRAQRAGLYFRLLRDGLANALIEHGEAVMAVKRKYPPVPWLRVLLVAIPGLWIALTRRNVEILIQLFPIIRVGYALLMVVGVPVAWRRKGRFPVWGLLFAGMLSWNLMYWAGRAIRVPAWGPGIFGYGSAIVLLNIILVVILFAVLLRGRQIPRSAWVLFCIIVLLNIFGAIIYSLSGAGSLRLPSDLQQLFVALMSGPAEALMLVAVGLLAARQYGVLATLVVIGGYAYMFMDTDYLFGYPDRDWTGISAYLFSVSFAFLVVTPVALLRARTKMVRALALFVPTILFLAARLLVPLSVLGDLSRIMPGDVGISINVLLALILAWILYSDRYESAEESAGVEQTDGLEEGLSRPQSAGGLG